MGEHQHAVAVAKYPAALHLKTKKRKETCGKKALTNQPNELNQGVFFVAVPPPPSSFFSEIGPDFRSKCDSAMGRDKRRRRKGGHWKTVTPLPQAGRQGPNPGGSWDEPASRNQKLGRNE